MNLFSCIMVHTAWGRLYLRNPPTSYITRYFPTFTSRKVYNFTLQFLAYFYNQGRVTSIIFHCKNMFLYIFGSRKSENYKYKAFSIL